VTAPRIYRSEYEIEELEPESSLEDMVRVFNKLVTSYNFTTKSLSFQSNFDGYLAENVKIPAASTVLIQHFLGVKPKWRIILKQEGNGVITDIPSSWTDKVIALYNNGAVEVTASILIVRE